ncbi:hypothetical protein [Halobellus marinus]|uniref:hypothetical protein n=1 Tax=Halobellus TaxID=1073986 RepID=UPI0028ADF30A|nr:hypothetical protein [Halobellus sp. DFY28]
MATGTLILSVGFAIYLGIRLEQLENIWVELDRYEQEIENEYLEFINDELLSPFLNELLPESVVEETTSSFPLTNEKMEKLDEEMDRLEREGVPAEERKLILEELILEEYTRNSENNPDNVDIVPKSVEFEDMIGHIFEMIPDDEGIEMLSDESNQESSSTDEIGFDTDNTNLSDGMEGLLKIYNMNEDILDPSGIFNQTRGYYRKHIWPYRLFGVIQLAMLIIILGISIFLIFSVLGNQLPRYLKEVIAVFSAIWIITEISLWYFLNLKVDMDTRTPIGKILKPDPRNIF